MREMFSSSSWTILCKVYGSSSEAQLYLKLLTSTPPPRFTTSQRFVSQLETTKIPPTFRFATSQNISTTWRQSHERQAVCGRRWMMGSFALFGYPKIPLFFGARPGDSNHRSKEYETAILCVTPNGPWEQLWIVHYIFEGTNKHVVDIRDSNKIS